MPITRAALLDFMRHHRLAVQSSVAPSGGPQSAVVGFVVSDGFEMFFDTLDTTRKTANLRVNQRIAFVVGGLTSGDERTVQYEGIADEPRGAELRRLQALYFERFPDGPNRLSWPGITYFRARPVWIRYSDFNQAPVDLVEFTFR